MSSEMRADFYLTIPFGKLRILAKEAKRRNMRTADLAEMILEAAIQDNLFAAILEQERVHSKPSCDIANPR